MLKSISWIDYIIAVSILLTVYYLLVCLRFFSGEIKDLFSEKRESRFKAALGNSRDADGCDSEQNHEETGGFEQTSDDEFTEVEHLIDRLKAVIGEATDRKLIPKEFKQYLGMVLKEYPSVRYSPLRSSINELIVSECERSGAVILDEDEVELLWKNGV